MEKFEGKYIDIIDYGEYVYLTCKVSRVSLEVVEEMIRERLEFTAYRDVCLLCDITSVTIVDKQARDYLSTERGSMKLKGIAVLVNSTLTKFLANFIIKVSYKDSPVPIRLFVDNEVAINWLKELEKHEIAHIS